MQESAPARTSQTLILHDGALPPEWGEGVTGHMLSPARLEAVDDEAAQLLRAAACVLVDGRSPQFVTIARRVHAVDPTVQVIAVAPPEAVAAARRALLFAPGLGEVWIASPTDMSGALTDRAAGVTRQRRSYERTRHRLERERLTTSPQRTERALISDAYLASLLRVLPDAVFSVDARGRVLSANVAAHRLFADGAADLVGRRLDEVLQVISAPASGLSELLRHAAGGHAELQFRSCTGAVRTGELHAASHVVQGIEVWAVVLRDVTEYHEALEQVRDTASELEAANEELQVTTEELAERTEEAERVAAALRETELSFRALADAIPTLAWTARHDGYIDWYNQQWYAYTGTTSEQMAGWGWESVHHPDMLARVREQWMHAIATGEPFEMTFPLRRADGEFRAFLTRAVPLRDSGGRVVRWFGTNTDVQAVQEARAAAEEARARADEANRAKSQFLANMSHELRTPLNAISGHVQLIEMELHGPVTDSQRDALLRVKRAQEHLLGLINDVLNFAKLESGRVEYDIGPLCTEAIFADVAPLMEPQFAARGLGFTNAVSAADGSAPRVLGDADKVRQVLLNLLSNAAKFTPPGGRVHLAAAVHDADRVAITVTDTGPGIPSDRREWIFEPFVQLRAQYDASSDGTGLGLAISRDLARGMAGDLYVEDGPDGGSRFIFLLPAAG